VDVVALVPLAAQWQADTHWLRLATLVIRRRTRCALAADWILPLGRRHRQAANTGAKRWHGRSQRCGGGEIEPGGGIVPGPLVLQAIAPGSVSSSGLARRGGRWKAGRLRSSMSSMFLALASR
jgi:hypothetical protein